MPKDPVCHMEVREEEAVVEVCDGVTYYFCSTGCREKFLKERTCEPKRAHDLIIISGGNSALQLVENLQPLARTIYLVSTSELSADATVIDRVRCFPSLECLENYNVLEFVGDKRLNGVTVRRRTGDEPRYLPVKGVFVAIGLEPNASLVSHLVRLNDRREIMIDGQSATSFPGIFAAGDVTDSYGKRIIINLRRRSQGCAGCEAVCNEFAQRSLYLTLVGSRQDD